MSILKSFSKKNFSKNQITFNHLFSQKSHLGTTLKKRDPKMDEFLIGFNNSNDTIFNLELVISMIRRSFSFMKLLLLKKKHILIVGTGFKFRPLTKFLAQSLHQPYVAGRWPKGLLTNWENLSPSIKLYGLYLKKLLLSNKQKINLETCFSGLQVMKSLPSAIFILDLSSNQDVIDEARRLNIPIIAIIENNSKYINYIDYPIPVNGASVLTVSLLCSLANHALSESREEK